MTTWTETISITLPGAGPVLAETKVALEESDEALARRLSTNYPPGTLIGVGGQKWRVQASGQVCLSTGNPPRIETPPAAPSAVATGSTTYAPGQVWKPQDPRRKSEFRIKAVTEDEVIAEDGRTVKLDRMKRYVRVT